MSTEQYKQNRTCDNCGHEETRLLDELSAAFEQTRAWEEPCPKCGSIQFNESCPIPALSRSILEVWATNDGLSFLQQDEDLFLASGGDLELILEFLDSPSTHIRQRRVLASALHVIWYDAYPETSNVATFTIAYEIDEENTTFEEDEEDSCCFQQVSPESFYNNEEFADKVAKEINKRTPLFIELGADEAEEFGKPMWYLGDYLREAFPLRNIAAIRYRTNLKLFKLFLSAIIVVTGISLLTQSPLGVVILLLGIITAIESFQCLVNLQTSAGSGLLYPIAIWEQAMAQKLANDVNTAIVEIM